ncbi:MAG: response regulator [Patescibacteria group bacterium]
MKKVLVVEDDKFLANAYRAGFEGEGLEVSLAFDGEEALAMANQTKPDVIILDILIPKIDGFSVLQQLKANKELEHIPVIIASNLGQKQDIDKGLELGATDFIIKSESSVTEILNKIKNVLK